jgi:hypothetical protein
VLHAPPHVILIYISLLYLVHSANGTSPHPFMTWSNRDWWYWREEPLKGKVAPVPN